LGACVPVGVQLAYLINHSCFFFSSISHVYVECVFLNLGNRKGLLVPNTTTDQVEFALFKGVKKNN
jgi:hypothetical protein